ncbi:MAG: hypothetical protein WD266_04825 [Balneolales bacterium]
MKRRKIKLALLALIVIFIGFIFADSLGVFSDKDYRVVPHGSHNHYVPLDRDPDAPLDAFPTQVPAPGERITSYGEVVRD